MQGRVAHRGVKIRPSDLTCHRTVANGYIFRARNSRSTEVSNCHVAEPVRIKEESGVSNCDVLVSGGVSEESVNTQGDVPLALSVGVERKHSYRNVAAASRVVV